MAEPIKLHRCSYTFLHTDIDACWKVEKALREQGIEYEVVKEGWGRGDKSRANVLELTGQKLLPVLELPGGEIYREESADMAARVRSGELGGSPQSD